MKKTFNYSLLTSNENIEVKITTHKEFVECIEDNNFSFKNGKSFIDPKIEMEKFETIVIKCIIPDNQRTKLTNYQANSSMEICYEVIDTFIKENWTNNEELLELESLNCNHFEMQFKYLIFI